MRKLARAGAVSTLVAAGLALAACGGTVIDEDKAEDAIFADLERDGVKVQSVDCPGGVDVEAGSSFQCEVVAGDGLNATATLRIRNEDADLRFVSLKAHK